MKVIGYVRVSTGKQVEEGVSLEVQETKIRQWADLHDAQVQAVYRDEGISGKSLEKRPGIQEALQAAQRLARGGESVALVVFCLSRLTRSLRDILEVIDGSTSAGFELVSLSESLDTSTPMGRAVVKILTTILEWQREDTAEVTQKIMAQMRAEGLYTGGRVPYGYTLAADGSTLDEDPEEQKVITRIQILRAEGYSLRRIAARLNDDGVPTKEGAQWTHKQVGGLVTE